MNFENKNNHNEDVKTNLIAAIIGISVSLIVIVVVFILDKNSKFGIKSLIDFNYYYFSLALSLFLLSVLVSAFRIKIMAIFMNTDISLIKAFNSVFMGLYVSNITPSAIGGQPYQIYLMSRYGMEAGIASAIVITQFVTTNVFNLLIDLYILPYLLKLPQMSYMWIPFLFGFSIFLFMMFSVLFMSFNKRFMKRLLTLIFSIKLVKWFYRLLKKDPEKEKENAFEELVNFHDSTMVVWSKKKFALVIDFILASLSRILILFVPYIFYISFFVRHNAILTFKDFLVAQFVTLHVAYFIPTPGSSGGFEATFLFLFASRINPRILSMVILGWRFVTYYFVIIFGAIINIFTALKSNKIANGE